MKSLLSVLVLTILSNQLESITADSFANRFQVDYSSDYNDDVSYGFHNDYNTQERETRKVATRKMCQICEDRICEELMVPRRIPGHFFHVEWDITCVKCQNMATAETLSDRVRKEDLPIYVPRSRFSECYKLVRIENIGIGCAHCHQYIANATWVIRESDSCFKLYV